MSTVSTTIEIAVAQLLGLSEQDATSVVELLVERGWLAHGIATIGGVFANRSGVELPVALADLAGGSVKGGEFSDYELRAAHEESEAEIERAIADLDPDAGPLRQLRPPPSESTESSGESRSVSSAQAVQASWAFVKVSDLL